MDIEAVLDRMWAEVEAHAERLAVKGVAGFMMLPEGASGLKEPWYPELRVIGQPGGGHDADSENFAPWDFMAVFSTIALMVRTSQDSGRSKQPLQEGEVDRLGGLTWERDGIRVFVAVTGGTDAENVGIAQRAQDTLNKGLDEAKEAYQREWLDQLIADFQIGFIVIDMPS